MSDLKLFVVLVGGKQARARLELHDMVFVAAHSIEETIPAVRKAWWGTPSSLHIDAWAIVERVDGFRIQPVPKDAVSQDQASLFFVNTGGYRKGVLNEEHAYSFHVGANKAEVWKTAKARAEFASRHKDNFEEVEDVICISDALEQSEMALQLTPSSGPDQIEIVAKYLKLQKQELA